MIRRLIKYTYRSWTENCGCCSNSESYYDIWENGVLVNYDTQVYLCSDEDELRAELKHLEPFDIHSDCEWF